MSQKPATHLPFGVPLLILSDLFFIFVGKGMKEYAPEYTKKEKLIRLVAIGIIGVAFGVWFKLKGLPYLVSITVEP